MGFSRWSYVQGRASVADFFEPGRRCGIYVLRFSNEEFYVGQALDVTRRYAQHRKTHADIDQMAFKQVPRAKLDEEERALIWRLERQGWPLRNVTFASLPKGESDFDLVLPLEEQERWLDDPGYADEGGERLIDPELRRRYREQCIRIGSAKERAELVVDDLARVPPGRRSLAHPVLDGEELGTYRVDWRGKYLLYDKEKLYNPKSPAVLDVPKVLLKRVAPSLKCCPDVGTSAGGFYYPLNTIYALVPRRLQREEKLGEGLSLFYLVALLNGRLLDGIYKMLFEAIGIRGGYIEFREFVRHLPIRKIRFTTPVDERGQLRAEGGKLYAQFRVEGDPDPLLSFVADLLPRRLDGTPDMTNERSDAAHDLLDHLGREMVKLNDVRRVAVENFALDLEGVLSADDLQHIGRLWTPPQAPKLGAKNYEKKQARYTSLEAEALEWLGPLAARRIELREDIGRIGEEQWKWLLKHRLKKVAGMSELVHIYRRHRPHIAMLEDEIASTLGLIDQIVYALYGLNEEEIAAVESASLQA